MAALAVATLWRAADGDRDRAAPATMAIIVTRGPHDVSLPLRDVDPRTVSTTHKQRPGGNSAYDADRAPVAFASVPDGGAAEQTSAGPRAALSTVASFNSGLNGALDNNIAVGPNNLVAMINSRFKVMTKTGNNSAISCSDTQGNTYVVATTQWDSTNNQSLAICYAANVKAGANTVTASFGSAAAWRRVLVHEYRGVALVNPVDVVAKNLTNGTTTANAITSGAAVTTASGDLIFGAVMDDASVTAVTAGAGFTQRQSVNNKDLASEDQVQAAAGSIATTQTFGAAHRYLAQMVAFRKG